VARPDRFHAGDDDGEDDPPGDVEPMRNAYAAARSRVPHHSRICWTARGKSYRSLTATRLIPGGRYEKRTGEMKNEFIFGAARANAFERRRVFI
jgi:hypothetical protein